ncbi:MAG: hypothetical protein QOE04_2787 [Mycobacterium sp.]|nr:hypothetical protein [Mycobacterium sp.]
MACLQHVAYSAGVGSDAGGMPVVWLVFDVDGAAQPSNRVFHRLQIADLTPSRRNDASRKVARRMVNSLAAGGRPSLRACGGAMLGRRLPSDRRG